MRIIDAPQAVLRLQYRSFGFPFRSSRSAWSLVWVRKRLRDCFTSTHWDCGRGRGNALGDLRVQSVAVRSLSVAMRCVALPSSTRLRIRHDSSPVPI